MQRGYTVDEIWQAIRRRAPLGLLVASITIFLGAILLLSLPNEYEADATIILEPYRPHADLVTPAVTTLLEDRLRVARQQLLAGPQLEQVITKYDLYPILRKTRGMDAALDSFRRHLEVKPDGDSAVLLGFRTDQKDKAAPVVQAVAQGFVEANAELRASQAKRVLASIEKSLAGVRGDLDAQEARLKAFRTEHDGELPEQVDDNARDADRASHLLDSAQVYIRQLEDRRSALPNSLVSPEIEHFSAVEADLLRLYDHAVATESPENPERVELEKELRGIRQAKAQEVARIDTLRRQREEIAAELQKTHAEATLLQNRIKTDREHAANAARWGTVLAVLERDRDMLTDKYKSLTSRRVETEVSLGLEQSNGPDATRIVDPPAAPVDPSSPDRMKLMLVVLALALALGTGVGTVAEARDLALRTPLQAREQLEVPLVGVLPTLRLVKK
jgi:uncharacterized protein involved in exopolysaccharide biosynthesis